MTSCRAADFGHHTSKLMCRHCAKGQFHEKEVHARTLVWECEAVHQQTEISMPMLVQERMTTAAYHQIMVITASMLICETSYCAKMLQKVTTVKKKKMSYT